MSGLFSGRLIQAMPQQDLPEAAAARIRDRTNKASKRPEEVKERALDALQKEKPDWFYIRQQIYRGLFLWAGDLLSFVLEEWASIGIPSADFEFIAAHHVRNISIHAMSKCITLDRDDFQLCPSTLFLMIRAHLRNVVTHYREENRFRLESMSVAPPASPKGPTSQAGEAILPLISRLPAATLTGMEAETESFIADHFSKPQGKGGKVASEGEGGVAALVFLQYDLVAGECRSVCVSTTEFESALYGEILEFVLSTLSQQRFLSDPIRIALKQGLAFLVRHEYPWTTASGAGSVKTLAKIVETLDEAILKWAGSHGR
ncbi:MAG: hypothetical protein ACLPX8_05800, partial [Bryobacteraceae bacterium]